MIFGLLAVTLVLFVWNRWRYDIVAIGALLAAAFLGLVPFREMFSGFGHPAVITVAAVLVLSRGLLNAGVVDTVARQLTRVGDQPWVQVAALTGVVALASGFMNNVGALALLMPVAIWMARQSGRSPAFLLMPLAFGSLLGGMLTMIGTPPNIIIAEYRAEATGTAFAMFDFLPVGFGIAVVGVIFIALIGWRLTPQRERPAASGELFEISAYLTEVRVPEGNRYVGHTVYELMRELRGEAEVVVVGLVRGERREPMPAIYEVLRADDILLVEADSDSLKTLLDVTEMELEARVEEAEEQAEQEGNGEKRENALGKLALEEAIVTPGSRLVGTTASALELRQRYAVNVLAVARQGVRLSERLDKVRFRAGDILLVQGGEEELPAALSELGCLPLASRGLRITRPRKVILASSLFALALGAVALGWVPAAPALVGAAVAMVLVGLIGPSEVYRGIEWPVIVLLAALLPVGQALETTGGSQLIADGLFALGEASSPAVMLALLMAVVMLLSNVVNNAAAAVLAAPVGIALARSMEAAPDPFLMAVAVGASCAFLTPIGHQSNTLVMAPGGYEFRDYWRMGLPLSLIVIVTAVPLILWIWPP
ncbi:potassium transporter TrkA [Thioalkalivibrio versutus]|uniref:Potassium transporter TrkA n=1 Tax=Thioalkalivibrio versutus TaxID=106634 RepID=A0A0G3G577_9GAMM|nr:SLC13 family permease [Thioalkalivibrio versutus]AKJ96408.1 potassium transporter TrkA [Thioalkalivibrio versutus]